MTPVKQLYYPFSSKILLALIGYFLLYTLASGQSSVTGFITDSLSNEQLDSVNISIINDDYKASSNNSGYFSYPIDSVLINNNNSLSGYFVSRENQLKWVFNISFKLTITNASGQTIFPSQNVAKEDQFSLGILNNGIYHIHIESDLGSDQFQLLSMNGSLSISKQLDFDNKTLSPDSLLFSKKGYNDRSFSLSAIENKEETTENIHLLKKSYKSIHFFNELLNKSAFNVLKSSPAKSHLGDIESIKAIIDKNEEKVYFINTKKYDDHYFFSRAQLNYRLSHSQFVAEQYQNHPNRYLFPITINYFKALDLYTFEFFSGDGATCNDVQWCFEQLKKNSYFDDKLLFYSTNDSWKNCTTPSITPNELFEGQNYQALNIAEGYGYLQQVDHTLIGQTDLQRHDIVLTNGIPIDIPVISGIITTEFQTPLSHINVLSHNRGTPNMALKDGYSNPNLLPFLGELIHLEVLSDSFIVSMATIQEATYFWNKNEPQTTTVLQIDTSYHNLVNLRQANINDVKMIGGKAANFAELDRAFDSSPLDSPVPENAFAIPFFYYQEHIRNHDLQTYIDDMLNDSLFKANSIVRRNMLKALQGRIIAAPINQQLLDSTIKWLEKAPGFTSYKFRSSTNAEDLEGFNGAGLYSSYGGKLNSKSKPIDLAIKRVWASLWNFTAFEERTYFKIDHASTAMGVLVHRSFPDEDANGVVITKNLFNQNHAYVVNVQFDDISVVDPEPGIIQDQVILYTFSLSGKEAYTIEYNSFSNAKGNHPNHVMTDSELRYLGDHLYVIKQYFYQHVYHCNCDYNNFGLDIEFKLDSSVSPRKLYIKQVRPF